MRWIPSRSGKWWAARARSARSSAACPNFPVPQPQTPAPPPNQRIPSIPFSLPKRRSGTAEMAGHKSSHKIICFFSFTCIHFSCRAVRRSSTLGPERNLSVLTKRENFHHDRLYSQLDLTPSPIPRRSPHRLNVHSLSRRGPSQNRAPASGLLWSPTLPLIPLLSHSEKSDFLSRLAPYIDRRAKVPSLDPLFPLPKPRPVLLPPQQSSVAP